MSHFRRAQSKVWFGNEPENVYQPSYQSIYSSIDREFLNRNVKQNASGGSGKQAEQSNTSASSSWSRQGSPSSHKSQDSGFSDAENSPGDKNHPQSTPERSSKNRIVITINESQSSPAIDSDAPTPPTVIRNKFVKSPELHNARRLTYSAPNSPVPSQKNLSIFSQIDELDFDNFSPDKTKQPKTVECTPKRRPLCFSGGDDSTSWVYTPTTPDRKTYNNETVILGNINESNGEINTSLNKNLPTYLELFPTNSSTPKRSTPLSHRSMPHRIRRQTPCALRTVLRIRSPSPEESLYLSAIHYNDYTNPLLNGHALSVQTWLDETKRMCYNEVMSTLQTKSIAVEAARNSKVASMTAVQIVRNVQEKVTSIQIEFERTEKTLKGSDELSIELSINSLVGNIGAFLEKIISKNIYQADNENDAAKFEDNVDGILDMSSDLRQKIFKKREYDVLEDVLVLKRLLLIVIHAIFDRLIKIIVTNLEESRCHLILKSNLNYIGTLSNMSCSGFASLSDSFCSNGIVRMLLLICLQEKQAATRALALRAIATVCSSVETIAQFEHAEGIDIVKDILTDEQNRSEQEIREAISVLTQITAPWHGRDHRVDGLRESVEALVVAITRIIMKTDCAQMMLLCAACLNNLSRLESTSIYSIMANETILCLRDACQFRTTATASIFLFEQITSLVFNMSLNKKSHHHLADKSVISFLVAVFEERFYDKYETRAENDALKRTIKNLLHIFSRLIHESNVGHEILANNMVPIFSRVEQDLSLSHRDSVQEFSKDITYINRKLNESLNGGRYLAPDVNSSPAYTDVLRRQISFV